MKIAPIGVVAHRLGGEELPPEARAVVARSGSVANIFDLHLELVYRLVGTHLASSA